MAKKIEKKKRLSTKQKNKKPASASSSDSTMNIDIKGATKGDKGTEFHLSLGNKDQGATKGDESHLYIGSKGGDEYDSKKSSTEKTSNKK